ncbi:MAG TPA: hypothetical protein VLL08_01595 [Kineosporiaceae bacterium]|nr:hypothetical protein [Kineosporiaceae bacterium]
MSKITAGLVAGVVLTCGATLTVLAISGNGSLTQNSASNARSVGAARAATPVVTATKAPALVLPVPAPKGLTANPNPSSVVCRTQPATPNCAVNSVRYVVKGTTQSAHSLWMPVLTEWGMTSDRDSCLDQPAQADILCIVQGVHAEAKVTVLFKAFYVGQYAPATVKIQTDVIRAKAMTNYRRAKTTTAQAKILQAAAAKIAALETKADDWNAAHPSSTVNVLFVPE